MARYTEETDLIEACKNTYRKVDIKVEIDWFGEYEQKDGYDFDEILSADDEFLKLDIRRRLEGDVGVSIRDQATLVLDNSQGDYWPKNEESRFNEIEDELVNYNVVPNRIVIISLSINGGDYYPYYTGFVSRIVPQGNKVSIEIEDPMAVLKQISPPDRIYYDTLAEDIIRDLLDKTPIKEYNIQSTKNRKITYNFNEFDNIFNALQKIAEMVWGYFYTSNNTFYFKTRISPDFTETDIVETLSDDRFFSVQEEYSSNDLYTNIAINSEPLHKLERQAIWTGSQEDSEITEVYYGDDLDGDELQLTHTLEDSTESEPTQNVPIVEGSVIVEFADRVYRVDSGLDNVDYEKGIIYFTDSEEYPLPEQYHELDVTYTYYIRTLAPGQEKTIEAILDDPALDIVDMVDNDIEDYGLVARDKDGVVLEDNSFDDWIGSFPSWDAEGRDYQEQAHVDEHDTDATFDVKEDIIEIDITDDTKEINISCKANGACWYKDSFLGITDWKRRYWRLEVDLLIDGEVEKNLFTRDGKGNFETKKMTSEKIDVSDADKVEVRFKRFLYSDGIDGYSGHTDSGSAFNISDVKATIYEEWVEDDGDRTDKLDFSQEVVDNQTKVILKFRNDSEDEIILSSEYRGEDQGNLILLGEPLVVTDSYSVEEVDEDVDESFRFRGQSLSIQNDMYKNQDRMQELAAFLLNNYSTPRSIVEVDTKGLIHLELFDKVEVDQQERDIDKEFYIYEISDKFDTTGNWEQTLILRQADESEWQWDNSGGAYISGRHSTSTDNRVEPPQIQDLEISLTERETDEGAYPVIRVDYDLNDKRIRFANIYYRKTNEDDWTFYQRTEEDSCIIDVLTSSGDYKIKVQSESHTRTKADFDEAPTDTLTYKLDEINLDEINLEEKNKQLDDGTYIPTVEVSWDNPTSPLYSQANIYMREEESDKWYLEGSTKKESFEIRLAEKKAYYIRAVSEDIRGNEVDFDNVPEGYINVEGKTISPSPIEFREEDIEWKADKIILKWHDHPDPDFDEYEVRLDDNFGE